MPSTPSEIVHEFLKAACVPLDAWHGSGTLEEANGLLAANPWIAGHSLETAAVLGEERRLRQFLESDPMAAKSRGGPHNWDPLTYLCFSRYLRLDRTRSTGFLRSAEALLVAGADPNTGFFSSGHLPQPEFESVLYGAAGIAHDAALTRLLLKYGANPNDGEVPYHAPEGWDNEALQALVECGRLTQESLAVMLARKSDWHDYDGIKWLLEQGANPNLVNQWGRTALHQAVVRDNRLQIIEVLLAHGADPHAVGSHPDPFGSAYGKSAVALAACRGRGDVLELLERKGISIRLAGLEVVLAACARHDAAGAAELMRQDPGLRHEMQAEGAKALAEFAGNGNTMGVEILLDLGVDVNSLFLEGDGYFDVAPHSTALHVAAWRARHDTVKRLIERGADVNRRDGKNRSPLALAVRACVDSYWQDRRSPDSVRALLQAGATPAGVKLPCGYEEVDKLFPKLGSVD